jgi:hypothetical protein
MPLPHWAIIQTVASSVDDVPVPSWFVPLVPVAVGLLALIAGVIVALINRRPSQQATLLKAMQENREADKRENQRLDKKVDGLYDKLGMEREYSMEWEDWHAAGMPDPPGRPRRKQLTPTPE